MSPTWKSVFADSVRFGQANGMEVTIAGSPGWSETGGPWVAPEDAMKKYVWSAANVEAGHTSPIVLPHPPTATGPFLGVAVKRNGAPPVELKEDVYRDTVVVAFPTPDAERASTPSYSSSVGRLDLLPLAASDLAHTVDVPLATGHTSAWIVASYQKPVTLRALTLGVQERVDVEIQFSSDGVHFTTLLKAPVSTERNYIGSPEETCAFAATTASFFRVQLAVAAPEPPLPGVPKAFLRAPKPTGSFHLTQLRFEAGARVSRFESKAGFISSFDFSASPTPRTDASAAIQKDRVLDLTSSLKADGTLDWVPPSGGSWTILRFGYSLTGHTNGPAEAQATGLEVDKLDADLVGGYMQHYLGLYQDATGGKLGRDGVQFLLTDSWEAGVQNWSAKLPPEFKTRRGYDAVPYLPVLAGRVVGSADRSDRFLWDFRETLKEMLADNHYGAIAKALHEHGMGYYTEAQGDSQRAIGDGYTMKSRADIPTGEFWYRRFATAPGQPSLRADLEEAASVAHVYGKKYAASESLTVAAGNDPWAFSPRMMKPVLDEIFARGINRILMHESHHQPLPDAKPGLMMAIFGQFFNRNDTWADYAAPWVSYISRSSYLLQQGKYVADVAYFYGEDRTLNEIFSDDFRTGVPEGYHYDFVSPEVLMTMLSVKNGRVVTSSGMSYRVLFVPPFVTRWTVPGLKRLAALVNAGAVVVASRPVGGLGVQSDDAAIEAIASELWGDGDPSQGGRVFGKGRVYAGGNLQRVLAAERVHADVTFNKPEPDREILTLHRRTADADIYFLSNQRDRTENVEMTFRVSGRRPELWHAENGHSEPASYRSGPDSTTVPMTLLPFEAVFMVFRRSTCATAWTSPPVRVAPLATLTGPWTLSFQRGRGAPAAAQFQKLMSWTDSSDPGVRFFSGTATYEYTLPAPEEALQRGAHIHLDLGDVREIAQVFVNGKTTEVLWHAPYVADITGDLHAGMNQIEVKVTNLWPNRLIGDKQPNVTPVAFAPQSFYQADSPLLESGLLGPVRLMVDKSERGNVTWSADRAVVSP